MASIGQTVEIRGQTAAGMRGLPAAILAVGEDGTLVIQDALHRVYHVHPSRIRREVRLHPKRARAPLPANLLPRAGHQPEGP